MNDKNRHESLEADEQQQRAYTRSNHPDLHEINDWPMYGPKNAEIERLVSDLTLDHGMRLAEVEAAIVAALVELREKRAVGPEKG